MSDTSGYRDDAREKRRAVIAFRTTWRRFAGPILGALLAVSMAYAWLFIGEREVTFRCTRDERGEGTCEHAVHYVAWQRLETLDVRQIRGARVQVGHGKSGPTYRTFLNVEGIERPLGEVSDASEQLGVAAAIDRFARDPSERTLDERYGSTRQFILMTVFFIMFCALGVAVAIGTRYMTAPRRLVLDENTNTATLERKLLFEWSRVWAVPLDSVRGARVLRAAKGFLTIVVDTNDDGALTADDATSEDDPAVRAITRFVKRDD